MDAIPVVDMSALLSDRSDRYEAAATRLSHSLRAQGYAAVVGHGMAEEELREVFGFMRRLFALPPEEKAKAKHPETLLPHRGYSTASLKQWGDTHKSSLKNSVDCLEAFDFGHEDNKIQDNIWLPDEPHLEFRNRMVALFERLNMISLAILEGLISGMNLSKADCEELRRIHSPMHHQMRLAHYLPLTPEDRSDPELIRLAPHTDFASYTLLFQESVGGLEFQDRETGKYIPATPRGGVMYLNIGTIMERYSNGFYPAAMHRVVIPPAEDAGAATLGRYSIPYFTFVALEQSIYPLPSRVEADGGAKYEPIETQTMMHQVFRPPVAS